VRRAIGAVFSDVDLLVTNDGDAAATIEEAMRLPTVSIPCGFNRSGLPIGMQISGPRSGEAQVLALAHAYEQLTEVVGGT
jgi:Asp-tRNA(Asn)/Glu-tRNA(Gln) amidotransferase A subunit family amidase